MKKLLSIILIAITIASACILGGCNAEKYGKFYNIEEAYKTGLITKNDLISIAYHHNGGRAGNEDIMPENYSPKPIEPKNIDNKTEKKIKKTYYLNCIVNRKELMFMSAIKLTNYYGKYNECYAVGIIDLYNSYDLSSEDYLIGDVLLKDFCAPYLKIWKEN